MSRVVHFLSACLLLLSAAVPARAQTNLVFEPPDYTIERYDDWDGFSGRTTDAVRIVLPINQLSGGESVTVTVNLAQALGIDLANSTCFSSYLSFSHSNLGSSQFLSALFSIDYLDATGAIVVPFWSGAPSGGGGGGGFITKFGTTEFSYGEFIRADCAPFTAAHGVISQFRFSFTVPSYYSVTTGMTTAFGFNAFRLRTSGTEVVPPLLVKGADGIAIQVAVSDANAALTASGVSFDNASTVGAQLQLALEATVSGDGRTAALAVRSVFQSLDALVESGEVLPRVIRELRPNILKAIAGVHRIH
jgi:hypothetical protein